MMQRIVFILFLLCGVWSLYTGIAIHAKALVAQVLLERAWQITVDSGETTRPWPWADTWPVARLVIPRLDTSHIVLAGVSGQSLAFGPGLFYPAAGAVTMPVIAGHRDTHFRFLQHLLPGDEIQMQMRSGERYRYYVRLHEVVDASNGFYWPAQDPDQLLLVTCFPFDDLSPGGPLRYLVHAGRQQEVVSL